MLPYMMPAHTIVVTCGPYAAYHMFGDWEPSEVPGEADALERVEPYHAEQNHVLVEQDDAEDLCHARMKRFSHSPPSQLFVFDDHPSPKTDCAHLHSECHPAPFRGSQQAQSTHAHCKHV